MNFGGLALLYVFSLRFGRGAFLLPRKRAFHSRKSHSVTKLDDKPEPVELPGVLHTGGDQVDTGGFYAGMSQCQWRIKIVRKRRTNFAVFRRGCGNEIKRFLAQKEYSQSAVSVA